MEEYKPYKFDGGIFSFISYMRWTMVVREMKRENHPDLYDTMADSARTKYMAEQYGMDDYSMLQEMVRLGKLAQDAIDLLDAVEERSHEENIEKLSRVLGEEEEN